MINRDNPAKIRLKKYKGRHEEKPAASRKSRAAVRSVLVILLCVLLPTTAYADVWDLTLGSVDISFQDDMQYVTQNSTTTQDSNPVITSNSTQTDNTISVSSGEGQTAQFTIENVTIVTDQNTSAIDIADDSSVEMTVSGTNSIDMQKSGSTTGNAAAIHVADAQLTIQGDSATSGTDTLNVNENGAYRASNGAGIGSSNGEDFTGTVNIDGDIAVNASGTYTGAAIGSGNQGDFSGELNITNGAAVSADSANNAAAIGGGQSGEFAGSITISDSDVTATSYNNGAGIGGGYQGDFSGSLTIENSEVFARAGYMNGSSFKGEAAGIGAGYNGDFSGQLTITDSTVEAVALHDGAGIGAGGRDSESQIPTFSGTVTIDDSNVTAVTGDRGIPIGAPEATGEFGGSVSVTGNSVLTLVDGQNASAGTETLIGGSTVNEGAEVNLEDSVQIKEWSGTLDRDNVSDSDRNSYQQALNSGEYTEIPMTAEGLAGIIKGIEIKLTVVPKLIINAITAEEFWTEISARIKQAEKGDRLIVDAGSRVSMPVYILELAEEHEVTLVIVWDGGEDIEIDPELDIEIKQKIISFEALAELITK